MTTQNIMIAQLETPTLPSVSASTYKIEGLIEVFTSTHRSFFTDVIAQALRIAGQGTPVLVVQLLKGGIGQGPNQPVKLGANFEWLRCNLSRCIDTPQLTDIETKALEELWQYTQSLILEAKYSLVILDELSLAINLGLIPESEVVSLLKKRPAHIDIILTGPEMPESILAMADRVTEIRRHQP